MTTLTLVRGQPSPDGAARLPAFLRRLLVRRRVAADLAAIGHLPEHMLRDIGLADKARYAILANREAALTRLRDQAQGGAFFTPPA